MKKLIAALAVLAIAAAAQADLLASWNFTGSSGTDWADHQSDIVATLGENVASATLTVNVPDGVTTAQGYGNGANQLRLTQAGWGTGDNEGKGYIDVKLAAASGYTLTVEEIDMRVNASAAGKNGTAFWTDGSGNAITESWSTDNSTSFKPTLTSNPSGSTVELRLLATLPGGNWGFNGAGTTGTSLKISGKAVEGTSVPEPATMSLLGLGALAMVLRRKLRK